MWNPGSFLTSDFETRGDGDMLLFVSIESSFGRFPFLLGLLGGKEKGNVIY